MKSLTEGGSRLLIIKKGGILYNFFTDITLLLVSALVFSLSFPGFLSDWGLFPLAFISLVPVFIVVHRSSWKTIFFYGFFYGLISYTIFNYWLSSFYALALLIVPLIYAIYFIILFPLLKAADSLFPKYGYLVQALIWIGYEYLKTLGFLGYPYGILGYTQYLFTPLIQISSITGVWGVSFLVLFPSIILGNALKTGIKTAADFLKSHKISIIIYFTIFTAVLIFGFISLKDYSENKKWKVALIQHNADTWESGFAGYERNFGILKRLSLEAAKEDPDIVMWSETAFVPSVDWHSRYRTNAERTRLVKEFKDFMTTQDIPYVTGNDDGQLENPGMPPVNEDGTYNRVDYNAVFLYHDGELKDTYRKIHLVPFSEHFPYEKQLPWLYQILVDNDYHFWEKGTEYTVFNADGVKFSTPICYEDIFGYLCRDFVNNGADIIVNLSNDSWSGAVSAEMQHMAMAVFRTVETGKPVVRSTNSGITCTIDPNGRIIDIIEPFTEGFLVSEVPLDNNINTLYLYWGDWFAHFILSAALLALLAGLILFLFRSLRRIKKIDKT